MVRKFGKYRNYVHTQKIRAQMVLLNYTNETLSQKLGVSKRATNDIIFGRSHPKIKTMIKLSMLLETDIEELFDFSQNPFEEDKRNDGTREDLLGRETERR